MPLFHQRISEEVGEMREYCVPPDEFSECLQIGARKLTI